MFFVIMNPTEQTSFPLVSGCGCATCVAFPYGVRCAGCGADVRHAMAFGQHTCSFVLPPFILR